MSPQRQARSYRGNIFSGGRENARVLSTLWEQDDRLVCGPGDQQCAERVTEVPLMDIGGPGARRVRAPRLNSPKKPIHIHGRKDSLKPRKNVHSGKGGEFGHRNALSVRWTGRHHCVDVNAKSRMNHSMRRWGGFWGYKKPLPPPRGRKKQVSKSIVGSSKS